MRYSNLQPKDVRNLATGTAVGFVGLSLFFRDFSPLSLGLVALGAAAGFLGRELAQRLTAHLMRAGLTTHLSRGGVAMTAAVSGVALALQAPLALLLPIYSELESERYEQWGYSIDVMWSKRGFWLGLAGTAGALSAWAFLYGLGLQTPAACAAVLALSQLAPLNEKEYFEGKTDGAHILMHSGLIWLLGVGLSLAAVVFAT